MARMFALGIGLLVAMPAFAESPIGLGDTVLHASGPPPTIGLQAEGGTRENAVQPSIVPASTEVIGFVKAEAGSLVDQLACVPLGDTSCDR